MNKAFNCVICGVGGQGNVLASRLIAHVLMQRGQHVKTAETIGMAQRGGSVASHVRGSALCEGGPCGSGSYQGSSNESGSCEGNSCGDNSCAGSPYADNSYAGSIFIGAPYSPLVPKAAANLLIAFEPAEALRCFDYLAPDGKVLVNTQAIQPTSAALSGINYGGKKELDCLRSLVQKYASTQKGDGARLIEVDGELLCRKAGSQRVLNIIMLAAACKHKLLPFGREELESAVCSLVKKRFHELNLHAIDIVFSA